MHKIIKGFKYLYHSIFQKVLPVKYAIKIGVRTKPNFVHIYGVINWGTEPWIISIGKNVHLTHNLTFITHDGGTLLFRNEVPDLEITKPITIHDNVYIGMNSTILPGVTINSNIIVGACSVVTKDLESNYIYAGNPAKKIKSLDEYKTKIISESIGFGNLVGRKKDKQLYSYYEKQGLFKKNSDSL